MVGRWVGWGVLVMVVGCADDAVPESGESTTSSAGSSSSTSIDPATTNVDSSTTDPSTTDTTTTATSTSDASTTSETTNDTTDGASTSSSSTGVSQGCDDGIPGDGEVCLVPVGVASEGVSGGRGLATGDVDGDGDIDLFTAAQLLRNEGGVFEADAPFTVDGSGYPAAGLLKDDDFLDVVVPSSAAAFTWEGDGTGTLTMDDELAMEDTAYATAIADVVGSPHADVLVVSLYGEARVFEGSAIGFTADPGEFIANELRDAATADFDGDGRTDFVAASHDTGAHVLVDGAWIDWPGVTGYQQIATGDVDGDGSVDIVGTPLAGGDDGIELQRGDGDGGSLDATFIALPFFTRAVALADIDGDGALDIAVASYSEEVAQVGVLLGAGDGTFAEPVLIEAPVFAYDLVAAELNDDGAIDLAVYGTTSGGDGSTGEEVDGPVLLLLSNP